MNIINDNAESKIATEKSSNGHTDNIAPILHTDKSSKVGNGQAHIAHPQEKPSGWNSHLKAAKNTWNKLNEDEILKSGGDLKKLSALIQQRYSISIADAEKQVHEFLSSHKV